MHWLIFAAVVLLALVALVARVRIQRGRVGAAVALALVAVVAFEVLVRTDTISARAASGWMTVVVILIAGFVTAVLPRLDRSS